MPRLAPDAVPKYRLHKQSGQAIITLNGRDHLLGKHNTPASRQEYDRLVSEWIAGGRHLPDRRQRQNVEDIILAFWSHAKAYYRDPDGKPAGELENFRSALRLLKQLYAGVPAAEFTPTKLRALREKMIQPQILKDPEAKKVTIRPGWCRTNANRQMNRIRHVFKWAVGQELIPPAVHQALLAVEPLRKGRSSARETAPVRPVAEQHVEQVLDVMPPVVRAIVELQALTGARGGELFKLRGIDIDTSPTTADARRGCTDCRPSKPCFRHSVWLYKPALHKTAYLGHEREIRFGPRAQEILRPYLLADLQASLFSPAASEAQRRAKLHQDRIERDDATPLSCGNTPGTNRKARPKWKPGDTYNKNSYAAAIARACDVAFPPPERLARARVQAKGRKQKATRWETPAEHAARLGPKRWAELLAWRKSHRFHPHQLRHAVATRVRRDFGLEAAQAVLGQRSIDSTQLYAERNAAAADRVIAEIG